MNNAYGSFRFTVAKNNDYTIQQRYTRNGGEVTVTTTVSSIGKVLNQEAESFDTYDNAAIERYSLETVQAFREAYGFTGAFDWADQHGRVFHVNAAGEKVYSNQVRAA